MRPQHNHITQSHRSPVTGCPACALIRPEVMTKAALHALMDPRTAHIFGSPRTTKGD